MICIATAACYFCHCCLLIAAAAAALLPAACCLVVLLLLITAYPLPFFLKLPDCLRPVPVLTLPVSSSLSAMSGHVLPQDTTDFSLQELPEIETFGRTEMPGTMRGLQQWQQRQEYSSMQVKFCMQETTKKLKTIESDCATLDFIEKRMGTAGGMPSDCLRHHSNDSAACCLACFPGLYKCLNTGVCCPLTAVVWLCEAAVRSRAR